MPRSADRGITLYRSNCISPMPHLSHFRLIAQLLATLFVSLTASAVQAQGPRVHYQHAGKLPPGAIGSQQLLRGGPLHGYFQPVEIKVPPGALVSLAVDHQFSAPQATPLRIGMLIAPVYRFRVSQIPERPGAEVFPSIEVINRIYPPLGEEFRFPIPIELTLEELEMALNGKFVTRVIYLEDPKQAVPVATGGDVAQTFFEVRPTDDPLAIADQLGRPVAILRIGGRLPEATGPDAKFMYGSPMLLVPNSLNLWTEQGIETMMPLSSRRSPVGLPKNSDRIEPPPAAPAELQAASLDDYVIAKSRRSSATVKVSDGN
jgi:hypothetical protein